VSSKNTTKLKRRQAKKACIVFTAIFVSQAIKRLTKPTGAVILNGQPNTAGVVIIFI
jgi:hypothetical protein